MASTEAICINQISIWLKLATYYLKLTWQDQDIHDNFSNVEVLQTKYN